ncbi:protein RIC-3 [Spea bombifrons]|uniref:protein RIC-3 n=1 Tax=Spea bombifrons TaxID=233779 RepID=UPI00234BEB6B|nr:protein RIC-3 [Spea bombifrons]
MALSTIQKVALFSCLVLCVSLLLPKTLLTRGKPSGQPEGNPGHFPSARHQPKPTDGRSSGSFFPRSHLSEAVAKAKGGRGAGGNSRQSLVGQIIPIYGFGILLYILYILFKLSSKGKSPKIEQKSQPMANGNLKRKITDYELGQLQDKLKETEEAMEKIISRLGPNCERTDHVSTDEEQQLLQRLKEITRVMKEGKLLDGITPEQEAEEAPYMEDWEGYPEETYPIYEPSDRKHDTILVDCSELNQPSAEEIAEQMEFAENDEHLCAESPEDEKHHNLLENPINSSNNIFRPPQQKSPRVGDTAERGDTEGEEEEDDEDDPAVLAENAGFHLESCSDQGDLFANDISMDSDDGEESPGACDATGREDVGTLRKRSNKRIEY